MQATRQYLAKVPIVALLVANMVPLWGVLFLGWDAFSIVLLYWAENLVIGFYNIAKMALSGTPSPAELEKITNKSGKDLSQRTIGRLYHASKLFFIPFFVIHYGGFAAGHGFFVLTMFGEGASGAGKIMPSGSTWPCFFVFVQMLLAVIRHAYLTIPLNVRYAVVALFISHGVSFVYNYLYRGEYKTSRLPKLMGQPYARVVVMHIAILAGGFASKAMGSPVAILVMLVVLKTAIDIKLHLRQHRKGTKTLLGLITGKDKEMQSQGQSS